MFVKMPSDMGFSDEKYILPELIENIHEVQNQSNWIINGQTRLFNSVAKTMSEVRQEQQGSVKERCEKAIQLSSETCVYWCNFNDEGDLLDELDKDAVQLKGGMSIDKKEDILINFAKGNIKRIITKPKITGFGLNWQHCKHTIYFPTWSYEQYYQSIRRFWRFGQKQNVTVDLIVSDGQKRVIDTLLYKKQKTQDFNNIIRKSISKTLEIKKENSINIIKPKFL